MRTVKKTLAWFILLAFIHLAFSEDQSKPKCKKLFPSITIETNNTFYYSFFDKRKRVTIRYGDFLQVSCIGNGKLAMTKDGEYMLAEIKDGSISAIIKPDRQISKFVCSDGETGCQRSVIIYIEQVIKVVSGNIEILNKNRTYTIKYGSPLEVLCSGIGRFVMTKNAQRLPIEQNETIKWFERKPELQSSEFICTDIDTSFNISVMIKVTPLMSIRTGNETVKIYQGAKKYHEGDTPLYPVTYGDDFEVFCFGEATHILAENKEITEYMNETTSKGFIEKFDKIELILNCIGDDDGCVSTIKVVTKPRIYVTSPNMRIGNRYILKYGDRDRVDIFCSAATTKKLKMAHHHESNVEKLTFITVNETTIKYVIDKPEILLKSAYNTFVCLRVGKALSRIYIEIQPETENFRCVSHNRQYLNCTWNALSHISNLTLSFIQNGISIPICEKNVIVPGLVFYVWHQDQYPVGYKGDIAEITFLNFVMQSCNYIACFNQSFVVDHLSIVKLNAPWRLTVNSTSTKTVRLRWFSTFVRFRGERFTTSNGGIVHKVEYWYSGIQPLEANSSLISCSFYCEIELKLPCPGQSYEVWIYKKLAKVGDEFWSDPSSISFHTDIDNDKTRIVDEICTQKPRKTKEVMIYFVQELREHVRLDQEMQQSKYQSLKDKRDKIRAYLDRDL